MKTNEKRYLVTIIKGLIKTIDLTKDSLEMMADFIEKSIELDQKKNELDQKKKVEEAMLQLWDDRQEIN